MFRSFIILGIVFLFVYAFVSRHHSQSSNDLQIVKLNPDLNSQSTSNDIEEGAVDVLESKPEEKTALREIALNSHDQEQLKLKDFHAYLRHEDRVASQKDPSSAESILSPEQRRVIAKERLAVRLIDELGSQKAD